IQGAKVYEDALYATRDDDAKTIFKIDLHTGDVTKLFSIGPTDEEHVELEGIAIRPTPEGLLHVLTVLNFDTNLGHNVADPTLLTTTRVTFRHFAPEGCDH
ncbi:MAG: hypothetical protein LC663_02655, partial [Actinobacteria bacterium]|nr:hypothetical protein [Actinomycetota bacterium]